MSACRRSAKAVPQLRTCSCKTPVSIVAVGSSHNTQEAFCRRFFLQISLTDVPWLLFSCATI